MCCYGVGGFAGNDSWDAEIADTLIVKYKKNETMNIINLYNDLKDSYKSYLESFVSIKDRRRGQGNRFEVNPL